MHKGIATFTLDYGKVPPWLFERMVKLARIITVAIVDHYGADEFVKRMSDPVWFQSFGSVLAFDWNASGLTTTTMGALKEAIRGQESHLGVYLAGGKGKTSKKTPEQIMWLGERANINYDTATKFSYLSKLTAKVDSALVQDGFQLYHHNFMFTRSGHWTVIQQGMNTEVGRARRYHWYSDKVKDPTIEPHQGIQSEVVIPKVLNLVDTKSLDNRSGTMHLVKEKKEMFYEIKRIKRLSDGMQLSLLDLSNEDFHYHPILKEKFSTKSEVFDLFENKRLEKALNNVLEKSVEKYEDILMTKDVGPKTMRALTLVSEVITGAAPSYEDPVRYSYAFGGKDGIPYPVNQKTYDDTMEIVEKALKKAQLTPSEKEKALRRNEAAFQKG